MESVVRASKALREFFASLHDPRALHDNPFAARFFNASRVAGSRAGETATAALHTAVVDSATRLRDRALSRGDDETARRQYRAIVDCDLGRKPAKRVAMELGISLRQFRRERSEART